LQVNAARRLSFLRLSEPFIFPSALRRRMRIRGQGTNSMINLIESRGSELV
jgi:hypothetical protein